MKRSATIIPHLDNSVVAFVPQAYQWVQLRDRLSDYSDDQALLLCPADRNRWVVWIEGYGEALLERQQFLKLVN